MKHFLLNLALICFGSIAQAAPIGGETGPTVITSVTNLTVTGQETVVSTMTVQGNAFSVGTSSFVVSGGSTTVAYRLTAGNISATGNIISNSSVSASGLFGATLAAPRINGPTTFFSSITIRSNPGIISFSGGASTAAISFGDGDYNLNIYNTPNVAVDDSVYNGIRLYNGGNNVTPKWIFERTGPLNIGNTVPAAAKLDVNGSAQFGSGVTRSTFSTIGQLATSSSIFAGAPINTGTQLYRCSGGTFAGNIVYGGGGLCTGGTAVAIPLWVP